METLVAALIILSATMGNYGTPPAPQPHDHGSSRGSVSIPKEMHAAPRPPSR